jgi:hypothetical protein
METRKGEMIECYEENDGWRYKIDVFVPAWAKQATILLQGQEGVVDLLFAGHGDASTEDSQGLSEWVKEKPPFEIGDEVLVRFT